MRQDTDLTTGETRNQDLYPTSPLVNLLQGSSRAPGLGGKVCRISTSRPKTSGPKPQLHNSAHRLSEDRKDVNLSPPGTWRVPSEEGRPVLAGTSYRGPRDPCRWSGYTGLVNGLFNGPRRHVLRSRTRGDHTGIP